MKILVVNLLRLGDVVMSTPVFRGLREKYPKAQIHFLGNKEVRPLEPLIVGVDRFHYFDRNQLQHSLADAEAPLFQALECLESWLRGLSAENFDQIVNLSQTRLSGLLVSQIRSKKRTGLHFDSDGRPHFESSWFQFLNDHIAHGGSEIFHYADIFQFGAGLNSGLRGFELKETDAGRQESETLLGEGESPICLQAYSSDEKKDWSEANWIQTAKEMQVLDSKVSFRILGAPAEREKVENLVTSLRQHGVRASAAICTLAGAYSLLKRSRLLISVDTSIKHMASAAGVPIVELALGPADERKTGAYSENAVILKPKIACQPCSHFSPCRKASHECGEALSPSLVSLVSHHLSAKNWNALRLIAREYSREAQILKAGFASDFWMALPLETSLRRWAFEALLNRAAWKLYLQNSHKKLVGEYGSESLRLKGTIPWIFPELDTKTRLLEIRRIEDDLNEMDQRLRAISQTLRSFARNNHDDERLAHLSEKIQDWVESNAEEVSSLQMLELSRKIQVGVIPDLKALRDLEIHMRGYIDRQDIKLKLIRSIKTNAMERV